MTDTVNVSRELLRQVFYYLNCGKDGLWDSDSVAGRKLLDELRTLLDAPAVGPVAYLMKHGQWSTNIETDEGMWLLEQFPSEDVQIPVYTAPQARQPRSTAIAECLQVLRPTVKGKFPQEQALEELVGYLSASQAQQPAPAQQPGAWTSMGQVRFVPPTCDIETYTPWYAAPQAQQSAPAVEQEPVADVAAVPGSPEAKYIRFLTAGVSLQVGTKLYDTPQPRKAAVRLSEADIHNADPIPHAMFDTQRTEFARALEAMWAAKNGFTE